MEVKDFEEIYKCSGAYHYKLGLKQRQWCLMNYDLILSLMRSRTNVRILDVGCGDGYFTDVLSRSGSVCGVDVSKSGLRLARKFTRKAVYSVCGAESLCFRDSTFDIVVCSASLQYILRERLLDVFGDVERVLKPGGLFVFSVPNPRNFFVYLLCYVGLRKSLYVESNAPSEMTIDEWCSLIDEAGFVLQSRTGVCFPYDAYRIFKSLFMRLSNIAASYDVIAHTFVLSVVKKNS